MRYWGEPLPVQQAVREHLRQLLLQVPGGLRSEIRRGQVRLRR